MYFSQLKDSTASAHSDNTATIKKRVLKYTLYLPSAIFKDNKDKEEEDNDDKEDNKDAAAKPDGEGNKSDCRWQNVHTARMLCLASQIKDFDADHKGYIWLFVYAHILTQEHLDIVKMSKQPALTSRQKTYQHSSTRVKSTILKMLSRVC